MAPDSTDSQRTHTDHYDNPYYLHQNDHAGLTLVTDRLTTASDFHSWRRSVRMALNVRNKLGFIDGTITKPSSVHKDYGAWSRCNDIVTTWLMNSVSKKIGQSLLFIPTAEGIWSNLIDLQMEMFRVIPNPSPSSSSVVEMHMGSIDDDRRLMWISEINKDGMQNIWRLTNHNTGGALLKMGKMFSFALNKIFWIEPLPHPSSHLRIEAVSKKGNKAMLSIPSSHCLYLFQHPPNLTSISYSSPRPINSVIRPYFPSFASPL